MRIDKNPFVTRASEYIEMEEKFIQLFSAEILQLFSKDYELWTKVNVIRSSPGGGKTTLLKLFTPKILQALISNKNHNDHVKNIFEQLKAREVFDKYDRINVIGTYISFNSSFTTFEYLPFPAGQQLRTFFSLVNIRAILSFFKSFCVTKELIYPEDLKRVTFENTTIAGVPSSLHALTSGSDVYQWAIHQEERIFETIDNINMNEIENLRKKF